VTPPRDLTTELDALEDDATKWEAASDDIQLAHGSAQNLDLGEPQFGWVAAEAGLVTAYEELQNKLVGLLNGAFEEFDKIGVELRATAADYGRTDTEGADRLNSIDSEGQGTIQDQQQGQGQARINE